MSEEIKNVTADESEGKEVVKKETINDLIASFYDEMNDKESMEVYNGFENEDEGLLGIEPMSNMITAEGEAGLSPEEMTIAHGIYMGIGKVLVGRDGDMMQFHVKDFVLNVGTGVLSTFFGEHDLEGGAYDILAVLVKIASSMKSEQ